MSNFLDVDESILARNLIVTGDGKPSEIAEKTAMPVDFPEPHIFTPSQKQEQAQCKFIVPLPGFCVKTKDTNTNEKVFLNFCKSDDVQEPDLNYPDYKLAEILDSGTDNEIESIRIPISIAQEKRYENDKSGNSSLVVDIIVNANFMDKKIKASEIYKLFLINVSMEGVEEKHKVSLDKNGYIILTNRKAMGKLQPQFVRYKPSIQEIKIASPIENELKRSSSTPTEANDNRGSKVKRLVEEVCTNENQLECRIVQTTKDFAKAEIVIPNLRKTEELKVSLGADRIVVESPVGGLDIFVPLDIHQEECRAEFNCETNILTLELPLALMP